MKRKVRASSRVFEEDVTKGTSWLRPKEVGEGVTQIPGAGASQAEGTACAEAQGVCATRCKEQQAHVAEAERASRKVRERKVTEGRCRMRAF